jgi:hypothetical protein
VELETDDAGNPYLSQLSEDGFIDCVFRIVALESSTRTHTLILRASHAGVTVGLTAVVVRGIQGALDADMKLIPAHVYRPAVRLLRTGPESDHLLTSLARLYGLEGHERRMVEQEALTGIALHQPPIDLDKEEVNLKLFGNDSEHDPEDDYYESFFNVDLPNRLVFWNEKDPDYRAALVRGLSFEVNPPAPGHDEQH